MIIRDTNRNPALDLELNTRHFRDVSTYGDRVVVEYKDRTAREAFLPLVEDMITVRNIDPNRVEAISVMFRPSVQPRRFDIYCDIQIDFIGGSLTERFTVDTTQAEREIITENILSRPTAIPEGLYLYYKNQHKAWQTATA